MPSSKIALLLFIVATGSCFDDLQSCDSESPTSPTSPTEPEVQWQQLNCNTVSAYWTGSTSQAVFQVQNLCQAACAYWNQYGDSSEVRTTCNSADAFYQPPIGSGHINDDCIPCELANYQR